MRKFIRRTITNCHMQHSFCLPRYVLKLKASTCHPCDSLTSLLETVIQIPDTVMKILLSRLVGYPKCKVRCSVVTSFPLAKIPRFSSRRTPKDTRRCHGA